MSQRLANLRTAVLVAVCLYSLPSYALTIETKFVPAGQIINGIGVAETPAANTVGGGNLSSIVRAAADVWESLIQDEHTITLNFGWYPTGSISPLAYHRGLNAQGEPRRELLGSLAFNGAYSGSTPLFLDPTPQANEEFEFSEQAFADLGSGQVEVMREYRISTPALQNTRDLYSVALHEIGHALGLVEWSPFEAETTDGDIDVTIGAFSGSAIPVITEHLYIAGPIMSSFLRPAAARRGVTQTDLLAVCQVSQFSNCDLSLRPMSRREDEIVLSDIDLDGDVDGADFLAWQRSQPPPELLTSSLVAWEQSYAASTIRSGDIDQDGDLDGADFLAWQLNNATTSADLADWRAGYNSPANLIASFSVPEPASLLLVLSAVSNFLLLRSPWKP